MDLTTRNLSRAGFEAAIFLIAVSILLRFFGPWLGWESGYTFGVGYLLVWLAYVIGRAVWLGRKSEE